MYQFNPKASYNSYSLNPAKITLNDLTNAEIVVKDDNKTYESFNIKLREDFLNLHDYQYFIAGDRYTPEGEHFHTSRATDNFQHQPMKLWETQLNFAHCATSALGVCTDHLNSKQPMVRSLYRFHTYYHIRRILKRIQTPLPSDHGFDKYNNNFSLAKVHQIGDEYGASTGYLYKYENSYYFERTGTW